MQTFPKYGVEPSFLILGMPPPWGLTNGWGGHNLITSECGKVL
jgi:hypothetical protein